MRPSASPLIADLSPDVFIPADIETASNSSSADDDYLQTTSTFVGATGIGFVPGIGLAAQQTSSGSKVDGKNGEASKSGASANAEQTSEKTSGATALKAGSAGAFFAMLALTQLL